MAAYINHVKGSIAFMKASIISFITDPSNGSMDDITIWKYKSQSLGDQS